MVSDVGVLPLRITLHAFSALTVYGPKLTFNTTYGFTFLNATFTAISTLINNSYDSL